MPYLASQLYIEQNKPRTTRWFRMRQKVHFPFLFVPFLFLNVKDGHGQCHCRPSKSKRPWLRSQQWLPEGWLGKKERAA